MAAFSEVHNLNNFIFYASFWDLLLAKPNLASALVTLVLHAAQSLPAPPTAAVILRGRQPARMRQLAGPLLASFIIKALHYRAGQVHTPAQL